MSSDLKEYLTEKERILLEKLQQHLLCKSCQQPLEDPYTLRCNHIMCRSCFDTLGGLCCECGSVSRPKEAQRSVVVRNLVQAIDSFYHFPIPAQQEASIEPDESTPTSFIESLPDSLVISKFLQISQSEAEKDLTKESPISQVLLSPSKTKRAIINSNVENGSQPQLPSHTQEESGQPSTMKIVGRSQKRKLHYADQENTFINDALEYSLFDHGPPSPTQSQIQPSHSQSEMEEFSQQQQQQQQSPPSPQLVERIISSQKTNHSDHIAFTSSFQSTPSVSISSNGANVTQLNISQPIATSYSGGVPPTITQSGSWVGAQVEIEDAKFEIEEFLNRVIQQREHSNELSPLVDRPNKVNTNCTATTVIALYHHDKTKALYEECSNRGWITCDDSFIHGNAEKKILITETTSEQNGLHLTSRSMIYMKCVLLGFLIVDYSWLTESLANQRLLDPHNYEIGGTTQDLVLRTPQRSRFLLRDNQGRIDVLEGYSFYIIDDSLSTTFFTVEEIVDLIILCKGNYLGCMTAKTKQNMKSDNTTIVLSTKLKSRNPNGKGYISVSWLFDVICHLRISSSFDNYYVD